MKPLILSLLAIAVLSAAPGKRMFSGTITDSMCARADHSQMRMGPTDAECTVACVDAHGATYVLYDGKEVYTLSDQRTPEKFAAQQVMVVGTLDAKTRTIQVDSMTADAVPHAGRSARGRSAWFATPRALVVQPEQFDDGIDVLRAADVNAHPAGRRHDVMGLRLSRRD